MAPGTAQPCGPARENQDTVCQVASDSLLASWDISFNELTAPMGWHFWQEHILANGRWLIKLSHILRGAASVPRPRDQLQSNLSNFSGIGLCGWSDRECHSPSLGLLPAPISVLTSPTKPTHYSTQTFAIGLSFLGRQKFHSVPLKLRWTFLWASRRDSRIGMSLFWELKDHGTHMWSGFTPSLSLCLMYPFRALSSQLSPQTWSLLTWKQECRWTQPPRVPDSRMLMKDLLCKVRLLPTSVWLWAPAPPL